jgi:hypothetical protein
MPIDQAAPVCPYIDRSDPRCAERLTILNLREAFQFCFGHAPACPVHRQIRYEESRRDAALALAQTA